LSGYNPGGTAAGSSRPVTPPAPVQEHHEDRQATPAAGTYSGAVSSQVGGSKGNTPMQIDLVTPTIDTHTLDLDPAGTPKGDQTEAQYTKFMNRFMAEHPEIIRGPKKIAKDIDDNLISSLHYNDVQSGSRVFIQAPVISIYSGKQDTNFNETLWFSQVVQHARSTNQTLMHSLLSHTSGVALRWVTLLSMHDRDAHTQERLVRAGTLTLTNGTLHSPDGVEVEILKPYNEDEIATDFGKQFLTYKQDDTQKAKLHLAHNMCQQQQSQTLEEFIVDFRTLLIEAQINISLKGCQLWLVIHFFNGYCLCLRNMDTMTLLP
jgi:hypothetical protein